MAHHVLRDSYINVVLPIVYLELEAHEVGQDGRGTCLGLNWGNAFAMLWPYDGEALETSVETTRIGSCENSRHNIRSCTIGLASILEKAAMDLPFHAERAKSALVGNIAMMGRFGGEAAETSISGRQRRRNPIT